MTEAAGSNLLQYGAIGAFSLLFLIAIVWLAKELKDAYRKATEMAERHAKALTDSNEEDRRERSVHTAEISKLVSALADNTKGIDRLIEASRDQTKAIEHTIQRAIAPRSGRSGSHAAVKE